MHTQRFLSLRLGVVSLLALVFAAMLASCGGGGGTAASTPAAPVLENSLGISTATDTSTAALAGNGDGRWDGSGGGGGSDGGGGAGDGEFVQFNFKPNGTATAVFSWTVINSQYGIKGQTGTMNLTADLNNGGYAVINTVTFANLTVASDPTKQGNLFLSKSGQISGSLPLRIGSSTVYTLFNGTRYKDAVADLAQAAGTYFYGMSSRQASDGLHPETEFGTMKINADGTGRICSQAAYSDTCGPNGIPIKLTVDSTAIFKMVSTDTRNVLGYVLPRKNVNGVNTATIDLSFNDSSGNKRTGAVYAMALGGTFNPASITGAWTNVSNDPTSSARNASTGFVRLFNGTTSSVSYVQHDTSGGIGGAADCANPNFNDNGGGGLAPASYPGIGYIQSSSSGSVPGHVIPMGPDFFVVAGVGNGGGGNGLSVVRKYSSQTTANGSNIPC